MSATHSGRERWGTRLGLVLAIVWGIVFFSEWPDAIAVIGIALILGAGLFVIWRENEKKKRKCGNGRTNRSLATND